MFAKKFRTALRVLGKQGPSEVWALVAGKVRLASRKRPGGLVRMEGCVFWAHPNLRKWLLSGEYEGPERAAAKLYFRRDIPVVEFGGSLGIVSCLLNRRLKNPGDHVVVEANPQILPKLRENRNRNHCKFEVLHGAAGAEGKTVRIYIGESPLASSAIAATEESVEVPVFTLADILEARGFVRCALMCDIEGSELQLIRSEIETLRARVEVFIVEFHPSISGSGPVEETRVLLKDHGFAEVWRQHDVFAYLNSALPIPA